MTETWKRDKQIEAKRFEGEKNQKWNEQLSGRDAAGRKKAKKHLQLLG